MGTDCMFGPLRDPSSVLVYGKVPVREPTYNSVFNSSWNISPVSQHCSIHLANALIVSGDLSSATCLLRTYILTI